VDFIATWVGREMLRPAMVVGAGATLRDYGDAVVGMAHKYATFGINNMTHILTPDYHIWTNAKRFDTFSDSIKKESLLVIGVQEHHVRQKAIALQYDAEVLQYKDQGGLPYSYDSEGIYGHFRTCGCLSIYLAYIIGCSPIHVVGMDGYTLNYCGNQHCYGSGHTDSNDARYEGRKDDEILEVLNKLKAHGVNFKIITPTVYEAHYDGSVLDVS